MWMEIDIQWRLWDFEIDIQTHFERETEANTKIALVFLLEFTAGTLSLLNDEQLGKVK